MLASKIERGCSQALKIAKALKIRFGRGGASGCIMKMRKVTTKFQWLLVHNMFLWLKRRNMNYKTNNELLFPFLNYM